MRTPSSNDADPRPDDAAAAKTPPVTRRAFLTGAAALGVSAGALAGPAAARVAAAAAGPARGFAAAAQEPAAPTGQIIYAARMSELTTLHPFAARFGSALAAANHVNEGLTKFAPDFSIVPGLASEWAISEDQLTFTFTLREGVTWHDGQPFTPADVTFTIDAAGAEGSQSPAQATVRTYISAVETPPDGTVVIRLTEPYSPLLAVLAEQLVILPSHLLAENVYDEAFGETPVGTGPYRVAERQAGFITLEHNPDYWGEPPFTATIILRDSPEAAAQQAGLLAGELDVIPFNPTTMANLPEQGYPVFRGVAGSVHGINVDLESPLLQDVNVRKALQLALDRERIQSALYSDGTPANTVVSPAYGPYHNPDLAPITRDVAAAGALLDEAGWAMGDSGVREKDGQPLAFTYQAWAAQQWQDIAAIAQASWLEVGFDIEIASVELARLVETMSAEFQLATVGWPLTSDPIVGLAQLFQSTDRTLEDSGTRNVFGYKSDRVDRLLAEAFATTEVAPRAALAHQIQEVVYADLPLIPFAHPAYQLACQPGVELAETGAGALSSVGIAFFMNRWRAAS